MFVLKIIYFYQINIKTACVLKVATTQSKSTHLLAEAANAFVALYVAPIVAPDVVPIVALSVVQVVVVEERSVPFAYYIAE